MADNTRPGAPMQLEQQQLEQQQRAHARTNCVVHCELEAPREATAPRHAGGAADAP